MTYLLDTTIISEVRKKSPNAGVAEWFAGVRATDLYLSVLVVGEIRQGVERMRAKDAARAIPLESWLDDLTVRFRDRIVPITTEIAQSWGRLNARDRQPVIDSLLAATALTHQWILVSRNEKDLARTGVQLLNPFSGS